MDVENGGFFLITSKYYEQLDDNTSLTLGETTNYLDIFCLQKLTLASEQI